jgi:CRP-like cAMP-binding protein
VPGASRAGARHTKDSLLTTNYAPKSPSRRAADQSDEKIVIVRGALFNSSEKRLARVLLLMANFGKDGRPEQIVGKISQETLAEMIGTTRSRVSYFMNKFRRLGFIDYNGRIEVHSSLLSVFLNDQPNTVAPPP